MKEYTIILIVLAAIFLAVLLVLSICKQRYSGNNVKLEAIDNAKALCEKLLSQVALALFTEAERKFGGGTGKLKLSYVIKQFLSMLPPWAQEWIDPEWLTAKLEALLIIAKEEWQKNTKLLGETNDKARILTAMTFDEFVEYGKTHGANIVDGIPWSFEYKGCAVTHCEDGSYLITTPENGDFTLTPNDMLITCSDGVVYPCETNLSKQLFKNVVVAV